MCKRELLERIIAIVAELTEIPKSDILSRSRRADITDARYLVISLLHSYGVRTYKIAELMDIPERSIYYAITAFSLRSDRDGTMLNIWIREAKSRLQKHCNNSADPM